MLTRDEKWQKAKQILIDSAEEVEFKELTMIIWYQVYPPTFEEKPYGFSVLNGIIKDHPDKRKIGNSFDYEKAKKLREIVIIAEIPLV